jgi:hypothetical protein
VFRKALTMAGGVPEWPRKELVYLFDPRKYKY